MVYFIFASGKQPPFACLHHQGATDVGRKLKVPQDQPLTLNVLANYHRYKNSAPGVLDIPEQQIIIWIVTLFYS